jgi:hypothetical protein
MPEPTVYWHGSVVAWKTGDGLLQIVWALNPADPGETTPGLGGARPASGAAPARKGKRGKA